jgi:UDP-N-acetylmuramate--alanine ligase
MASPADYRATDIVISGASSTFTVWRREQRLGDATLNVPGIFNIYNALATIAVASEIDMDFKTIVDGLKTFTGVHRRLEVKGTVREVTVVDDYGHHPTEIRATLAAARHVWKGRMIVIFQPHRYTRTKALFQEFIEAFPDADTLIITDIYAASEQPIPGVHAEILAAAIRERSAKEVFYIADFKDIIDKLLAIAKPGDAIITQGAGTVWKIGEEYLQRAAQG